MKLFYTESEVIEQFGVEYLNKPYFSYMVKPIFRPFISKMSEVDSILMKRVQYKRVQFKKSNESVYLWVLEDQIDYVMGLYDVTVYK